MTGGDGAAGNPRLSARSVEDLAILAALLQDAIVPLGDMAYIASDRSFVLALNRFRWEMGEGAAARERIHSGLRFDAVRRVRYRGIRRADRRQFLSLLTISYDEGIAVLHFAGGGMIRLEVDELRCALEDFGEPWPTPSTPSHEAAG
jgi:hypothetical protein